jgi:hypothetical protein
LAQATITILLRHMKAEKGYSKDPECGRRVVNTEPCPRRYMQVEVTNWCTILRYRSRVRDVLHSWGQSAIERSLHTALSICGVVEESWRCKAVGRIPLRRGLHSHGHDHG